MKRALCSFHKTIFPLFIHEEGEKFYTSFGCCYYGDLLAFLYSYGEMGFEEAHDDVCKRFKAGTLQMTSKNEPKKNE